MPSLQHPPVRPLRLAVLDCDTPVDPVRERYNGGLYSAVFTALFGTAIGTVYPPGVAPESVVTITGYDVVFGTDGKEDKNDAVYPDLAEVDALLLSGSKHNSFDNDPWILKLVEFTKRALTETDGRVTVAGVCFGHQVIGRALGADVGRSDAGWEVSAMPLDLSEKGKEIFGQNTLAIHQMHRDVVHSLPPNAESLASTPICPIQGFIVDTPTTRAITTQGHPEFNGWIMRHLLTARQALMGDAAWRDGMDRVDGPHDGIVIATAFLRFMLKGKGLEGTSS